jgi:hypothetical protein
MTRCAFEFIGLITLTLFVMFLQIQPILTYRPPPRRSDLIIILNDILFVLDLFFSALDNQFRFGYLFVFKLKMDVV